MVQVFPPRLSIRRAVVALLATTFVVALSGCGGESQSLSPQEAVELQFKDGAEVSIFLKPDATQEQIDAIRASLESRSDVKSFRFVDKEAAYAEAQTLFKGKPDTLDALSVQAMPPSYRVVPQSDEAIKVIGNSYTNLPGVGSVSYADEILNTGSGK